MASCERQPTVLTQSRVHLRQGMLGCWITIMQLNLYLGPGLSLLLRSRFSQSPEVASD